MMSRFIGGAVPASVRQALARDQLSGASGQCIVLVTVDPNNQPRPCLLSVAELSVVDDRHLRAFVWPRTMTTANLDRGSTALFVLAAPPDVFHIRATARRLPDVQQIAQARFEFEVTSVEVDGHEGMPVTQPMSFAATEAFRDSVRRRGSGS